MRFSRFARFLLRAAATATAAALILGWPLAAALLAATGLAAVAVISRQLFGFARLMQRIVEAVASQAGLTAVEPIEDTR